MARASGQTGAESFFTVGLFSALEAMMDQPLAQLLDDLPFSNEIKMALLEMQGIHGRALSCVMAMERSQIDGVRFLELEIDELSSLYQDALVWADQQSEMVRA